MCELERQFLAHFDRLEAHLRRTLSPSLLRRVQLDDVMQDVFLRVNQSESTFEFRDDAKLFAWLKKVATNVVLSRIRHQARIKQDTCDSEWLPLAERLRASGDLTASQTLSYKESCERLQESIAELPEHYRDVLQLHYEQGLRFKQIAALNGKTAAAIRGVHRNALDALRKKLEH